MGQPIHLARVHNGLILVHKQSPVLRHLTLGWKANLVGVLTIDRTSPKSDPDHI